MTATSISVYMSSSKCRLPSLSVCVIFSYGCLVPALSLAMLIIFPLASVVYCLLLDSVKIAVFIPLVQNCCKVVLQLEEMLPNGLFTASSKILLAVRTPLPISIALPSKCFSATTEGITSAVVANRKLISLVKWLIGARNVVIFSARRHWQTQRETGSCLSREVANWKCLKCLTFFLPTATQSEMQDCMSHAA